MASARTLLFLPVLLLAQDARQDPQEVRIRSGPYLPTATLAVQTNLVEVGVTVRNRQRHPVAGLQAVDFELTDSGKLQRITLFSEERAPRAQSSTTATASSAPAATPAPDARPPHFIVLFFDDTHTESMALQKGREAAKRFIRRELINFDSVGLSTNPMQGMQRVVLNEFMGEAATATGGRFIQNSNDLSGGIRALTEPAEASYILGFSPAGEPDEKYHALKVRSKSSELRAESRPGYFSTRVSEKPPETVQQRIDRLAASKETVEQFAASVQSSSEEKDGRTLIHVDIAVAAKELKFLEKDGRHAQELTFVTMILDSSGSLIEGKQAVMSLSLTPGTLADLREKGIPVAASFSIPKGTYEVREVIREAVENRMVAKTTAVK